MRSKPTPFNRFSEEAVAHRLRCRSLPPLRRGESEALVSAFLAARSATTCPLRYAAPLEQLSRPSRSQGMGTESD